MGAGVVAGVAVRGALDREREDHSADWAGSRRLHWVPWDVEGEHPKTTPVVRRDLKTELGFVRLVRAEFQAVADPGCYECIAVAVPALGISR